jgi:hypothetical protein
MLTGESEILSKAAEVLGRCPTLRREAGCGGNISSLQEAAGRDIYVNFGPNLGPPAYLPRKLIIAKADGMLCVMHPAGDKLSRMQN